MKHGSGDAHLTATDGMSPIHAAAQAGQISCMEWLVGRAGVSPRYKAEDGATPAHFAAASGQVNCGTSQVFEIDIYHPRVRGSLIRFYDDIGCYSYSDIHITLWSSLEPRPSSPRFHLAALEKNYSPIFLQVCEMKYG